MSEEKTYLVADIGGTNARFGIARGNSDQGFSLEQIQRFKNRDFKDLGEAALAYLADCTGSRPQRGCIAVAGPVGPGLIQLTNSTWQFEPDALAHDLGLESLLPVNDFAAQARGAPLVRAEETVAVIEATPDPHSPCAVLGPGTGLGLGILLPQPGGTIVVPTEGGHAGFAPRTEEQRAVGHQLAQDYGFVSWERLLSGPGLVNTYRALSRIEGLVTPDPQPEEITQEALADSTSLSRRVVDFFCAVLGGYAGDVAVMIGARGGVYLSGGILPRIQPLLESSDFKAQFIERGPMSGYTEGIPVWLSLSKEAPLLGAAALAEKGGL
ncbi:MAG: glucokinase [Myxococcota bacterium]